ncbi:winged helix-turn-helix domain-containing protein [Neptunicella sp. SCSIO 80796]|uniref:winged helix-turn-helix domain-containing protein n=1 Tax=Neptunicella plasticusilytica TaxID=3117012 RepID=UPI003A4D41A6
MAIKKIRIKNITIDLERAEINKDGSVESLEPKLNAVLKILCDAEGNIVSQQTLLDKVWGDVVVTANTIQRCITQLRKQLNDDAKRQHIIKTHPKLGYSIVPPIIQSTERKRTYNPSSNKLVLFIVALSFGALIIFWSAKPNYPTLTRSEPVTIDGKNIIDITLSHQGDFVVFSRENNKQHQLVIQNTSTSQQTILADNLWIHGELALSPDDKTVSFGLLTRFEKHKCIQLVNFELLSRKITPLTKCSDGFAHSPTWIDNNSLAYLNTGTDHLSQIIVFNLQQQQSQSLSNQYFTTSQLFYSDENQILGWLNEGKIWHTTWQDKSQHWTNLSSNELPERLKQASQASWFNNDTLILTHNKTLYWLQNFQLVKQQPLPLNNQILSVEHDFQHQRFLVLQSRLDTSVNKRQFNQDKGFTDAIVSPSVFKEWKGKYQPNTNKIAFLSDRTGTTQIWLSGGAEQQLSHQPEDVSDYLWQTNNQLIFISHQTLWLVKLGDKAQKLNTEFIPQQIYQSKKHKVLMSALIGGKSSLIMYDTQSGQYQLLLDKEISWAQQISNAVLLSADVHGKLSKFVNGRVQPIAALPDLIIQSDFIEQDGLIFLQDKQLHVWCYDPVKEQAAVIGHYDENATFMTDFDVNTNQMLSNNQQAEMREAVWLSASPEI